MVKPPLFQDRQQGAGRTVPRCAVRHAQTRQGYCPAGWNRFSRIGNSPDERLAPRHRFGVHGTARFVVQVKTRRVSPGRRRFTEKIARSAPQNARKSARADLRIRCPEFGKNNRRGPATEPVTALPDLQILGRGFSTIGDFFIFDLLTLVEGAQSGALDG